jgi:N-acetylmuramoyl-L-alanine amidase
VPFTRPIRSRVRKPGNAHGSVCLALFLLAGCVSRPPGTGSRVPDWDGADSATAPKPSVARTGPVRALAPAPGSSQRAAPAATNHFAETWIPLDRWCRVNGMAAPCPLTTAPVPGYAVSTTNGVFVLRAGSQVAHWDGLEVRMAFAPQMRDGQPYIHGLDLQKTIQPLAWGAPMNPLGTNLTIVIDPGHGGGDSGTWSVLGYRYEKEFTLDWARRVGALLATNGWRVFLTRTSDTDVSISERIAFAEARKPDVFLSLHFNSSAPNDQQVGLETYCLTPTGMPSTLTRGFGDDAALVFPNNAFDAQNLQFAVRVHRALLQANGRQDRGVRRARFLGVLRGQNCPAILVEGGYLSNPQEARRISDPAYRQKLAEALAQALVAKPEVASQASGAANQRADIGAQMPAAMSTNFLRR